MAFKRILVASHGTPGARAAEQLGCDLCEPGGSFQHLLVVPDFWKGMLGDDWLNNAVTQARFGRYLEGQLEQEIDQTRQRVQANAAGGGLEYGFECRLGLPAEHLVALSRALSPEAVIIGSPRPKGAQGLRSRMDLETLARGLTVPLIIAPHPGS